MIDLWKYRARVVRVIDGDTVIMELDLGFHVRARHSIRIKGFSAPELFSGDDRKAGAAARDRLQRWLDTHTAKDLDDNPIEWPFVVVTDKDRQTFNRYIGSIWCNEGHDLLSYLTG